MSEYSYPRSSRLSRREDFEKVRQCGRIVHGRWLRLAAWQSEAVCSPRFGVVTSRKVGGAVDRSRVRRKIREINRQVQGQLPRGLLLVIIAKPNAAQAEFTDLQREWLNLAGKLHILPRQS